MTPIVTQPWHWWLHWWWWLHQQSRGPAKKIVISVCLLRCAVRWHDKRTSESVRKYMPKNFGHCGRAWVDLHSALHFFFFFFFFSCLAYLDDHGCAVWLPRYLVLRYDVGTGMISHNWLITDRSLTWSPLVYLRTLFLSHAAQIFYVYHVPSSNRAVRYRR